MELAFRLCSKNILFCLLFKLYKKVIDRLDFAIRVLVDTKKSD